MNSINYWNEIGKQIIIFVGGFKLASLHVSGRYIDSIIESCLYCFAYLTFAEMCII